MELWHLLSKDGDKGIVTYKEVNGFIEKDKDNPIVWSFKKSISYYGLKDGSSPPYLVPDYNVTNGWKNGKTKEEPITAMANDILNACDNYAKENEELETVRWKKCTEIDERKMQSDKKEAKLQSFSNILKYESGHEVPNIFSMH